MSNVLSPRRLVVGLLTASTAALTSLAGTATSSAAPVQASAAPFEAIAAADGLRVEVRTPNLLVTNIFDGGAPVAQATMNSLGGSTGFASMPYPGDSLTSVPGLVLPLLGLPSLPPYPLLASSSHPATPESTVGAGAFTVSSHSDDRGSEAAVRAGVDAGGFRTSSIETIADVGVDEGLGEVSATARNELNGLALAGVLTLGRVQSSATVVRGGATDRVESTFEVEGLGVAGLRVVVSRDGIEILGNDVLGLPDLGAVESILSAAGVSLEFLPETEVDGGIVSAGLTITMPLPSQEPLDGTMAVTLGRSRAVVAASAPRPPPTRPSVGEATSSPSPPAPVSPSAGGSSPVRPSTGAAATVPAATPAPVATTSSPVEGVRIVAIDTSTVSFYLVLAVGALVTLLGIILFRYFGVKLAWTS